MSRLAAICSDLLVMHYDLCFNKPSPVTVADDEPFEGPHIGSDDGLSAVLPKNTESISPADVEGVKPESALKIAVKSDGSHSMSSQQASGVASQEFQRVFLNRVQSAALKKPDRKQLDLGSVLRDPTFEIDTPRAGNSYHLGLVEEVSDIQVGKQPALDIYLTESGYKDVAFIDNCKKRPDQLASSDLYAIKSRKTESKSQPTASKMQDKEKHMKQEQREISSKTSGTSQKR